MITLPVRDENQRKLYVFLLYKSWTQFHEQSLCVSLQLSSTLLSFSEAVVNEEPSTHSNIDAVKAEQISRLKLLVSLPCLPLPLCLKLRTSADQRRKMTSPPSRMFVHEGHVGGSEKRERGRKRSSETGEKVFASVPLPSLTTAPPPQRRHPNAKQNKKNEH